MPRYTSDSRERVRDAIDFVELVNAREDHDIFGIGSEQSQRPTLTTYNAIFSNAGSRPASSQTL